MATSQRSTVPPASSGAKQLSLAPMAPENRRGVGAASVDRKPTTKHQTQNAVENPQNPSFDDETEKTTTTTSSSMPIAVFLDSGPSANQHEEDTLFGPMDLSWDASPAFMYWPLQNLDALAQREAPQPTEETRVFGLDKIHDTDCSLLPALDIFSEPMAFPVRNADTCDGPISERQDCGGAGSPYQQQQYFDDGPGLPADFFQDSPDFKHKPLPFGAELFRNPYGPRSLSPASTITLTPRPNDNSCPGYRGSLEWACKKCDKHFSERTALRKHLRYHVRPYSCPTCQRDFSFKKDLRRHQQTRGHGGQDMEKLLSCPVEGCNFKFKACRSDTYKRHCRLVHEARPGRDAARDRKAHRRKGRLPVKRTDKSTAWTSSDVIIV